MARTPVANYPNFVKLVGGSKKISDAKVAERLGSHLLQVVAWRARLASERKWS